MALPEPEPATGRLVAERYELVEEIARGGMGTVWVARDGKLGRQVALKLMRAQSLEAFPDARERFEREAKAAAALKSSHVVQVHDYGVDEGMPFIAMELLEGESLKSRLEKERRLSIRDSGDILRQVAKGLKAAHRAGLVHRDLKPSNIFLAHRDEDEIVKLLDFGVVKTPMERGSDDTASGVLLGTPQYMSPEQARGLRDIDYRADLWSLAVILYTMLTGHNPFEMGVEAVGDIVIRVAVGDIPPPSTLNPALPRALDDFFERALSRERDERFQTLDELVQSFMASGDISYRGLDFDTVSGDRWAAPVLDDLPRIDATTIAEVPRPGRSGWRLRVDRALPPESRSRRFALAGALALSGAVLLLTVRALVSEPETTHEPAVSSATPPDRAAPPDESVAQPAPDDRSQPRVAPSATETPAPGAPRSSAAAGAAPSASAKATTAPHPVPRPPPEPDDEEQPPQWFQDKQP